MLDKFDHEMSRIHSVWSHQARAADLAARLNLTEHVGLFFSYPSSPYIERLNVKSWSLDHTCIHGLNKNSGVTVFPHAIAQVGPSDADFFFGDGTCSRHHMHHMGDEQC